MEQDLKLRYLLHIALLNKLLKDDKISKVEYNVIKKAIKRKFKVK